MQPPNSFHVTPVWLSTDHSVLTAKVIVAGQALHALGVVDSSRRLIGIISQTSLVTASDDQLLGNIMDPAPKSVDASLTVRDLADEMIRRDVDFLPITNNGEYVGIVTARQLLRRLREGYDPLTELPWSDALRNWGTEMLQSNTEIAVLFIDLNKFGRFNKDFGHVVGDRVLQKVSAHLKSCIDPKRDLLVRYGGDEFAIGTTRERDEAMELANQIYGSGKGLETPEAPVAITFSIGIYGGRRTKERTNVHLAATLDNLINFASKDCQRNKNDVEPLVEDVISPAVAAQSAQVESVLDTPVLRLADQNLTPQPDPTRTVPASYASEIVPQGRPVVETIDANEEPNSLSYVVLSTPKGLSVGVGIRMGNSTAEAVAYATGKALEKAYPGKYIQVDHLDVTRAGKTELVTIDVKVGDGKFDTGVTAKSESNGDLYQTVSAAMIMAFFAV
jgi:IMP dehydrogenase